MRVFVTGATGFIGSAVVDDLLAAGHQVLGMARSDDRAAALAAKGAEVWRGALEDPEGMADAAADCDGVIHLAFNHDFSQFQANCETDRRVIAVMAGALAGSDRPMVVTSGTGMTRTEPGRPVTELDPPVASSVVPRSATEEAADAAVAEGANVSVMRLPQVHDTTRAGLVTYAIQIAREKGASVYIGNGANRWPAVHIGDVPRLYRMALEAGEPGARYHAVAEEGVSMRDIAEVLGRRLDLPVRSLDPDQAEAHFGWLAHFAVFDLPASSALTRARFGWEPKGPGLLADLERLELAAA